MAKKTQSIEVKNSTYLAFSHPDWFLPYATIIQQQKDIKYTNVNIVRIKKQNHKKH